MVLNPSSIPTHSYSLNPSLPHSPTPPFPQQRWQIATADLEQANAIAQATQLSPLLAQVLINRGITTPEMATLFLEPDRVELPSPLDDFADLAKALAYLKDAIAQHQPIAICGDYDADGMTSTALLMWALRQLGGRVNYAIPNRMNDGYGINTRIVEAFHQQGVQIILTVDNGIAAVGPIARAVDLGMVVIVTDHHDIPAILPPAQVILNPKLIAVTSPYRGLAGVGVAYILALELARALTPDPKTDIAHSELGYMLLDLFTLGTIADLAPLTGVNRRWVQLGLRHLPKSKIPGVNALIRASGLGTEKKGLKPDAIGFRLGPRINAVGRIADPITVIELLTTDDPGLAIDRAMACEKINQDRRQLCDVIEQEAIAHIKRTRPNLADERVLVIVQPNWHHGVIGIVASRLVERYGVPVFIGTYEDDAKTHIRGSARSIPEFDIHKALVFCDPSLEKYGGHRAAGGFTLQAAKLEDFHQRLQLFANMYLRLGHLRPLVTVDVGANFADLTLDLYHQIDRLHPCGIGNPNPIFWTPNVRVLSQKTVGKDRTHWKATLAQEIPNTPLHLSPYPGEGAGSISPLTKGGLRGVDMENQLTAIAWRWGCYCPLPNVVDIAYQLKLNQWQGETTIELDIVGIRSPSSASEVSSGLAASGSVASGSAASGSVASGSAASKTAPSGSELSPQPRQTQAKGVLNQPSKPIHFHYRQRRYGCSIGEVGDRLELRIRNPEGKVLAIQPDSHQALLGNSRQDAVPVEITHPHYFNLIKAALQSLETFQVSTFQKKE